MASDTPRYWASLQGFAQAVRRRHEKERRPFLHLWMRSSAGHCRPTDRRRVGRRADRIRPLNIVLAITTFGGVFKNVKHSLIVERMRAVSSEYGNGRDSID